jgi:hypothetical protein
MVSSPVDVDVSLKIFNCTIKGGSWRSGRKWEGTRSAWGVLHQALTPKRDPETLQGLPWKLTNLQP